MAQTGFSTTEFHDQLDFPERLLRIDEVARLLAISRAAAYRLAASGSLPAVRFGGCVRVRPEDLVAFVETYRTGDLPGGGDGTI